MSTLKRLVCTVFAVVLAATFLVGCQQEPATTQDLLSRSANNSKINNYHLSLNLGIEAGLFGQTANITTTGEYDVCDKGFHGTIVMDLSALQQPNVSMEQYGEYEGDSFIQYTGTQTDGKTTWVKSEVSGESFTSALSSQGLLQDAEFKKTAESDDSYYELRISGDKLSQLFISGMGDSLGFLGESASDLVTSLFENSTAVYTFDKDCTLRTISLTAGYDPTQSKSEEMALPVAAQLNLNAKLDNYGGVDASSVAVPEDVKNSAIEAPDAQDVTSLLTDNSGEQPAPSASQSTDSASTTSSASTTGQAA